MADNAHGARLPRHVAIIMDGNGRWAQLKGRSRLAGHQMGSQTVRTVVEAAARAGIKVLTLFAFSSENWQRPQLEVTALMKLFGEALRRETPALLKNNIKLVVAGDVSRFSASLQKDIDEAQAATLDCTGMLLQICANYGGRWDIAMAARALALKASMGLLDPQSIDESTIGSYLNVPDDVDLLIRTGGEQRVSNFLLWQSAYSEIWFTDVLWPDFTEQTLEQALTFFAGRKRRFGGLPDEAGEDDHAG